ncbi:PIG-L family deacetylase [Luteitalea sp.]|uniref:PIG-L family deacetylase n=1 Tax=Luteitalea sp. TaxID=2004800 RepID=UPI0025BD58BA|nr:PIG-L family deacetylase [Luteitalea sp.]
MPRPTLRSFARVAGVALLLALAVPAHTQYRFQPVGEHPDQAALGLVLRQLGSVGSLMMTTAHPDDENNALLARYKFRNGVRTTLVTATRGNGGQNEIGPEIFESLAVLRTEELLAAHRVDGAEQYFARAVDFGFSFSRDETFQRWHRDKILEDYVYWIRKIRPDVIVGFIWDHTQGGGQHHQASSDITAEAFRLAADASKFPAQIAAGLKPWQASKFYYTGGFGGGPDKAAPEAVCRIDGNIFDPLLGRTYNELGAQARSMHMCQGMPQLYSLPGPQPRMYVLQDTVLTTPKADQNTDMFAGIDTSLRSLARFGKGGSPALGLAIESLEGQVRSAQLAFETKGVAGARAALPQVLTTVRALRAQLGNMHPDADARYEVDFRLEQKERQAEEALRLASGLRVDLLADDGLIVGGQPAKIALRAFAGGGDGVAVKAVEFTGFDGTAACPAVPLEGLKPYVCDATLTVPAKAKLTTAYWKRLPDRDYYDFDPEAPFGLPFEPTPFTAKVTLTIGGLDQVVTYPVSFRHEGNVFSGEKRQELLVVPALAVKLGADVVAFPGGGVTRDISVTVTNHARSGGTADVTLQLPAGWTSAPAAESVTFAREDEARQVTFAITPPAGTPPGRYDVKAVASRDGQSFDKGYEAIEYPHIRRRHLVADAAGSLKVLDLKPVTGVTVGYIMGVGDQVPPALVQLGATVEFLTPEQLASADLSRFTVVMTGVRAYERRNDLRAYNQRLLDYAAKGGTVIVQYNKFEFNEAQYGPYPGTIGRPSPNPGPFGRFSADRVTDETAPVKVLVPEHPVFTTPNRIGEAAWKGWVQERGLYFFGTEAADKRYVDLVEMADPFPNNPGVKRGALVEARVGQGRWVYVGLNLWRQLPAGTDGAYALMANLLSLGTR